MMQLFLTLLGLKKGITYKSGAFVLYGVDGKDTVEQTLLFGLIEEVLVIGSDLILFLTRTCQSL